MATKEKRITRATLNLFVICATLFSCGEKEENLPTPDDTTGSVSYSIGVNGANGEGTSESPAVVQTGDTLNMAISQTSSYTDPNGSVFVCEPEAVIKLSTPDDTLYVKNFKELTTVKESSQVPSETSVGEKLTKKTLQTFSVGGKEVIFDLAYDIFNHINSQNRSIEMPYIKVNSANYGTAQAETRTSAAPVAITGMRITPHAPQTRGMIVDSTAYDVNVAFNLEIESVHAKEAQNQTLSFEIEFLAIVESTTEYPDPDMQFSYQLQILDGTASTASPFVPNLGETMHLRWVENSQYSYFSLQDRTSQVIQYEPKADVTLFVSKDTLLATNKQELEKFAATDAIIAESGTSPQVITGQKTFNVAGKDIAFNWNYDTYESINAEGSSVAVPHLELGEPQIISVKATEKSSATVSGKPAKIYEVEARFSQELKKTNTPEEQKEVVEYIVKFTGAVETVRLVKVVYRKDWEWIEPHDNIMLAYYPMVHRDRIYSNGETFTDTFRDAGHVAGIPIGVQPEKALQGGEREENGITFFYNPHQLTNIADSIITISGSVVVPKLSLVKRRVNLVTGKEEDINYLTPPAGTWDKYVTSKLYTDLDIPLDGVEIVGADSVSTKPSGWYFMDPTYEHSRFYEYDERAGFIGMYIKIRVYDQFLVIDGQMINFLEFREPATFNLKEENITMPNGAPGMVVTYDAHLQFLGRNFYGEITDTIYQQTPGVPSASNTAPRQNTEQRSIPWQKDGINRNSLPVRLPPPYKNFSTFEYGGDPFGTKR